jgi:tRNA A37 threonylcarbamoyladenosine synthetase subunit TsaC/SUA5/YrdC
MACPISNKQNYEKIYEIKQRDKSKAIAIMIEDFFYFSEQTKLNKKQIDFLRKYKNPFTILINKNKILDKKLLEIINNLDSSENYEKIAFRVAHNFMHRKLIKSH